LNARAAQERAADEVEGVPGSELELNLDTFDSFIDRRYPDRDQADRGTVSELVEELNAVGIDTIEKVEELLARGDEQFAQYEQDLVRRLEAGQGPLPASEARMPFFSNAGAARITVALASAPYREAYKRKDPDLIRFAVRDDRGTP
jgi:hypothetical protein